MHGESMKTGIPLNLHSGMTCHNCVMCGRYRLSRRKQIIAEHFDAVSCEEEWSPRYNIAPSQPIPVIRQTPNFRELSLLRWGLIPSWATDPTIGSRTINARSEACNRY